MPEQTLAASAPRPWLRSLGAGIAGLLATLAVLLTLGLLAFAPLGPAASAVGVPAAFAAMVLGTVLLALTSRASVTMAAPSSATAITLAALVARLAQDLPGADAASAGTLGAAHTAAAVAMLATAAACAVLGMGLVQLVFAAFRLARLAHFVPQPVLAGFLNGVALLIVLSQLPALIGAAAGTGLGPWPPSWPQPAAPAVALGLGTAVVIAWLGRRRPRWPALLLGLVAGLAAAHALRLAWPAADVGPMVGAVEPALPGGLALLLDDAVAGFVARHAGEIALAAFLLALIGALESLLALVAIEQGSGRRVAADRELAALGLVNVAGGLAGALPAVMLRAGALPMQRAGGRRPLAPLVAAATAVLVFAIGGPLLAAVPQAVLAGVMVMVGLALVDRGSLRVAAHWWRSLRSGRLAPGDDTPLALGLMLVVCTLTAVLGVAWGVAVGVALSLLMFVRRMHRALVRDQVSGVARPSRRIHPGAIEARLMGLRARVAVLELEGALFFGSGAQLPERIDALPASTRFVVFDLRRVSAVDDSGVMLLHEAAQRLVRRGQELLLAGVVEGGAAARALASFTPSLVPSVALAAPAPAPRAYADTDQAMEHAEAVLLAEAARDDPALAALLATEEELPLAVCSLVRGLSARELRLVAAAMQRRELHAGEVVFRQGDEAEALYVVTRGSVSAVVRVRGAQARLQRFASLGPGTMLGEMALVDQAGRSADAVADGPACLQVLTRERLEQLVAEHPEVAVKLYRNIAAHLGERLRAASIAWQAAAA